MTGAKPDDQARVGDEPSRVLVLADATALADWLRARLTPISSAALITPSPPTARIAAVLALLYPRDGIPYLLFTRRSSHLHAHRGEISFPGGSCDPGDSGSVATALREAREEIDLASDRIEILGALPPLFTVVSNFWVTPVVGWLADGLPTLSANPDEVDEIIEASVAGLADPTIYREETRVRNGIALEIPFYDYGEHHIWGLTGFITQTLLALLPPE